jgi:hypothetical protein
MKRRKSLLEEAAPGGLLRGLAEAGSEEEAEEWEERAPAPHPDPVAAAAAATAVARRAAVGLGAEASDADVAAVAANTVERAAAAAAAAKRGEKLRKLSAAVRAAWGVAFPSGLRVFVANRGSAVGLGAQWALGGEFCPWAGWTRAVRGRGALTGETRRHAGQAAGRPTPHPLTRDR